MSDIDFTAINRAALAACPSLLERLLPGGRVNGREYECADLSGGAGKSLKINLDTGKWADFASNDSGRDLIALLAAMEGLKQPEAARRLADLIGHSMPRSADAKRNMPADLKPEQIIPVPAKTSGPDMTHWKHGKPTEIYQYRDQSGQLMGYVCRFTQQEKDANGKNKKEFCPRVYTSQGWRWQGFKKPFPFYGLDTLSELALQKPLVIVEGEHKANALKTILGANMDVLGLYGGSGKVEHMDYLPLRGRRILYWPDKDQAGYKAALSLAAKTRAQAASVKIIRPPEDVKETWDAANAIEDDGWDFTRLRDWFGVNRLDPEEFEKEVMGVGKKEEQDKNAQPYHAIDIFDFMELELPEREDLVSPFLQTQGIAMLHAQRGIGKTFISLSIAHMVASAGQLFDRWKAPRAARVLYIDGEMPARAMQDRLRAICAGTQSDITSRALFRLLTPDLQAAPMPNLATAEGQKAIEPMIADSDFIVIDNLATLANYGRSNEEESWKPVQEWLLNLRRRRKTSLVIHHEGKNGTQRGTSAKEDAVDTVISLKRPKDYKQEEGARFEVHYTKCRHVIGKDAQPFEARLTTNDTHSLVWTTRSIEDAVLAQYRELRDSGFSIRDAAVEMGVTRGKAQWLEKLLKQA